MLQKTGQLYFDADGEKKKGDADISHELDAGYIINQFQTERPDENAGHEKSDDGGQFNFVENVNNGNGETENDDQLVKKFQSIHTNFRSFKAVLQ